MKTLFNFFDWRLDFALLLVVTFVLARFAIKRVRRRRPALRLPVALWIGVGVLALGGGALAEWVKRERTQQIVASFSGFGPTYAAELQAYGHAKITLTTPADDPTYLALIEAQKTWLRVNPLVADIYTFRRDDAGKIRLIVDSETDYDRNGRFEGDREQRTVIGEVYEEASPEFFAVLGGVAQFDSNVSIDRWGVWVSSLTPLYDASGRLDGAVGIDYPASSWITAIATGRCVTLIACLVFILIVILSGSAVALLNAEVQERRNENKSFAPTQSK